MLGTVDKIVNLVDDVDSFQIACDTTAQVTSNAGQMPTANQDHGSQVMASMGEKLKNFKSNDSNVIVNIAASMLGTVGNVFSAASGSVPIIQTNTSVNLLVSKILLDKNFINLVKVY